MNFDLSDEQRALASAAADFFTSAASPSAARASLDTGAPIEPGRKAIADTGFAAITVAESAGGGGGSVLDLAVVAEQAGRVLAGPSLVTAARAAVLLDGDAARLAALADGSAAYAIIEEHGGPVLDATTADTFLALRDGALVVGTATVTERPPIDATRGLADVTLDDGFEVVDADAVARWERALHVGQVVLAAEGLGTASKALEIGVEYAKQRVAFGRQIGSYQAIKHALVDAFVGVEQLRSLVWWAAWTADESPSELPLAAAAAKGTAAAVVEHTAETLVQVHGGIGFTWEHDAHLYWRRAKVDRFLLGDDVEAFDTVARLAIAAAS
ncbi:MAG TPA: acyl-CoA dehydrogenase family protein [Mycobacteriales bacterium]|nr:acyl-CoA dehydrogenase family protein [Mycobacteriales bacterium]